ncbi:hypothetical protein VPNG_03487 [Cytospora leucostoma]|uniref:Protein kinase domain-containing protein n=1 Tax=Cytospora leucostoma TaxID=1230097 RepID=A0A423XGE1_9PEZI|nr:hypothetical protein VPNG_03487 [Cytospora leucostoma]
MESEPPDLDLESDGATPSSLPSLQEGDSNPDEPSRPVDDPTQNDFAFLLWAPRNHKPSIKPTLRFLVDSPNDDGTSTDTIKYLTLDQVGLGIRYRPGWLARRRLDESEPFFFPKGNWNIGRICFFAEEDDHGSYYRAQIYDAARLPLPQLDPRSICSFSPKFEYVDLKFTEVQLREHEPPRYSDRIRVVTHAAYGNDEALMVMKIWPSPMCNRMGIEKEMLAYKAFSHLGMTPKFVGHVTEEGRVVGMLLEYIAGAHKPSDDKEKELCRQRLYLFHRMTGWHRSVAANHKDNFLIKDGIAYIIDFARAFTPEEVAAKGSDWANIKV